MTGSFGAGDTGVGKLYSANDGNRDPRGDIPEIGDSFRLGPTAGMAETLGL
jgi:hypothetical protein